MIKLFCLWILAQLHRANLSSRCSLVLRAQLQLSCLPYGFYYKALSLIIHLFTSINLSLCHVIRSYQFLFFTQAAEQIKKKYLDEGQTFKTSFENTYCSKVQLLFQRWYLILHYMIIPNSLERKVTANSHSHLTLCKSDFVFCHCQICLRSSCFSSLLSNC